MIIGILGILKAGAVICLSIQEHRKPHHFNVGREQVISALTNKSSIETFDMRFYSPVILPRENLHWLFRYRP